MAMLYAYRFNTEKRTFEGAEVEVSETEKQYSNGSKYEGTNYLPFTYKHKMLKSEIGKTHKDYNKLVVYLTERNGMWARQIILDYINARLAEHEAKVAEYKACVGALTGRAAD